MQANELKRAFDHSAEINAFRLHCNRDVDAFDILDIPAAMWGSIYLGEVMGPNSIRIRLIGNSIRDFFGKDIRGMDLLQISHGDERSRIYKAYKDLISEKTEFAIQQHTFLPEKQLNTLLECTALPLCRGGEVKRVIGLMFISALGFETDPNASFHKVTF